MTEIDYPGAATTEVDGLNNKGEIVGRYTLTASNDTYAFIDDNGAFSTFSYPGARATFLGGVNDAGQISGSAIPNTTDGSFQQIGFVASPVCFVSGCRVRTAGGDVAVENLAIGDLVIAASGLSRPIRWLGHRTIDCCRHPRPAEVRPVRIETHAFGPNRPARDLYVSPGHAICVEMLGGEVLVPAGALVNGSTVSQVEVDTVTYWHVELDSHDILLAENLPAESYLEMENRNFFVEAAVLALHAVPDAKRTHADFCRPFHADGPVVDAIRQRLAARAAPCEAASKMTIAC